MKINELLNEQEQLDEIPKWLGGTGGERPGTTSGGALGAVGTWVKKKTGMGTGGALLKQAAQVSKMFYNQWVNLVPALQRAGKIQPNDNDAYLQYLLMFVRKRIGITNKDELDEFLASVSPVPNKNSILKGFEKAYYNAIIQKQVGGKNPSSQRSQETIQPGQKVNYGGTVYTWANNAWRSGAEKLTGSDAQAATQTWMDNGK